MNTNINLVEDKQAREELICHLEVLDKVKAITYLTKDLVVTTEQVADYYGVGKEAIKSVFNRHKEELESNGAKVLKGAELKAFKSELQDATSLKRVSNLTLFTKRALLNVGMLLTESEVAERVRQYLLNLEENATDEQKQEAFEETVEQVEAKLGIKLLRVKHREEVKKVKIQTAIDTLALYGVTAAQANYVVQKAIVDKVDINKAVLDRVETLKNLDAEAKRGIIREKIDRLAVQHYDEDREMVYHLMSEKMRDHIGFNMRAHRSRLKSANEKRKTKGQKQLEVPSYLDIIMDKEAYDSAVEVIQELISEKEVMKANTRTRKPCGTIAPKDI